MPAPRNPSETPDTVWRSECSRTPHPRPCFQRRECRTVGAALSLLFNGVVMTWNILTPLGSNFPLSWWISAVITVVCGAWTDYEAGWKPRNWKAVQWSSKGLHVRNVTAAKVHNHISHTYPRNLSSSLSPQKMLPFPRPWKAAISHLTWLFREKMPNDVHSLYPLFQNPLYSYENRKLAIAHPLLTSKIYTVTFWKNGEWKERVLFPCCLKYGHF